MSGERKAESPESFKNLENEKYLGVLPCENGGGLKFLGESFGKKD